MAFMCMKVTYVIFLLFGKHLLVEAILKRNMHNENVLETHSTAHSNSLSLHQKWCHTSLYEMGQKSAYDTIDSNFNKHNLIRSTISETMKTEDCLNFCLYLNIHEIDYINRQVIACLYNP